LLGHSAPAQAPAKVCVQPEVCGQDVRVLGQVASTGTGRGGGEWGRVRLFLVHNLQHSF
jgi:hypothetical protein